MFWKKETKEAVANPEPVSREEFAIIRKSTIELDGSMLRWIIECDFVCGREVTLGVSLDEAESVLNDVDDSVDYRVVSVDQLVGMPAVLLVNQVTHHCEFVRIHCVGE